MFCLFVCFFGGRGGGQGKAPKEIHATPTETLACFLPGRVKDLSAPLYILEKMLTLTQSSFNTAREEQ